MLGTLALEARKHIALTEGRGSEVLKIITTNFYV